MTIHINQQPQHYNMQRTFNKAERKPYFRNGSLGVDIAKPSIWDPLALGATLAGWWDASDSSTITIATGVSQWNDKSGNSRTMSQATTADQPALISAELNGLNVLRCDGTGDRLATASTVTIRTLVVLSKWTNTTGNYRNIWDDGQLGPFHGGVAGGPLFDPSFSTTIVRNGDKYINGTLTSGNLARYTSWTIHLFEATGNITPQATGWSSFDAANRGYLGDYAEVLYITDVPTTTNRQKIEGYLAHKWGLTASLPNDHPYKSVVPLL
jgi:hypothetical protein